MNGKQSLINPNLLMKISVIYPSRSRPEQAEKTLSKWIESASSKYFIEWIVSIDTDDVLLSKYKSIFDSHKSYFDSQLKGKNLKLIINNNHSAIEAINKAASIATGDLLIVISDDFDCYYGWDVSLLQELSGKSDFVLKTKDGIQKTLVTLPIMDRKYYERFGFVYNPAYKHMGCDVELTAIAIMTGKLLYSDLVFPHLHYSTGLSPKDAINEKNDLTYQHGDEVLARHKVNNFGIENPLITYDQIQWH